MFSDSVVRKRIQYRVLGTQYPVLSKAFLRFPFFLLAKELRSRLAGDSLIHFPDLFRPALDHTDVFDARSWHHHGPDERNDLLPNDGPFLKLLSELIACQVFAVIGRAEVGLRLVQAPQSVAQERDELSLRPAAKAHGNVGHH